MDNSPKVEAYKSFYQQAKDYFNQNDIYNARIAFLKAAELANEISINSNSYDVRMEYHTLATKILSFVKKNCDNMSTSTKNVINEKNDSSLGKSEFSFVETKENITFKDVAGLEDVKEQIIFKVLEPLKNPEIAERYGITPGGKILLYGPPGTGKTFIAKAIAGEVDAYFYAINCQDLISKYMGESSKKLDKLFEEAESKERTIIFFDEFDAVASKRADSSGGVDQEMARFVATFLTKVDGFKKSKTSKMLLLIAATNRPWVIDTAMLRGGRFDTHILVGLPDLEARLFLINRSFKNLPLNDDFDIEKIADLIEGYGGGDIVAICNRIKLEAYKRAVTTKEEQNISFADFEKIIKNTRNPITKEDLIKFETYQDSGKIEI